MHLTNCAINYSRCKYSTRDFNQSTTCHTITHTHTYSMGYTLIIDNYDSFTWNVYADIAVLGGNPLVKRNDKITIDEIQVRAIIPLPPDGGPGLFP